MSRATIKRRPDVPKGVVYEGLVATRAGVLLGFGGNPKIMSRSSHVAQTDIRQLKIAWANTYIGSSDDLEQTPTTTATLTASIEYPSGIFSQILFNGLTSVIILPGQLVFSDYTFPKQLIPVNAIFWIRLFITSNGATCVGYTSGRDSSLGDLCDLNASTDMTMGGSITNTGANWSCPFAIIGPTDAASVIAFGDSITYGSADTTSPTDFRRGMICHGFPSATLAFLNHGNSTIKASTYIAGCPARLQVWKFASHVPDGLGRNDIAAGASAATLEASCRSIYAYLNPRTKVLRMTLIPDTTSSLGWQTDADQTPRSGEAQRLQFNTDVRAGLYRITNFFESDFALESVSHGGFWAGQVGTPNLNTADGTHPNAAGYVLVGPAVGNNLVYFSYAKT